MSLLGLSNIWSR